MRRSGCGLAFTRASTTPYAPRAQASSLSGRAFEAPPLTRFEATARRTRRFTADGLPATPAPILALPPDRDRAVTLDLCRTDRDRPLDLPGDWAGPWGEAPR